MIKPADPALLASLEQGISGTLPANVALMRMLIEAQSPGDLDAALAQLRTRTGLTGPERDRLQAVEDLWVRHPQAWDLVRQVMATADHAGQEAPNGDDVTGRWADTFDRLAERTPDAGMALYALGDPDLLARATQEVVERLEQWEVLGPELDGLEIGCGNGRFVRALSPLLRSMAGVDVSVGMVEAARRRCADRPNVRFEVTEGRDLARFADASVDLVLAADVFPYLVLTGPTLVEAHMAEIARVLRPGGRALILNFSYRNDGARDQAEVIALSARHDLAVLRMARGDFTLWDGATFDLEKPVGHASSDDILRAG